MEQLSSHWMNFHEVWYCGVLKTCKEISSFVKIWRNNRYFMWRPIRIYGHILLTSWNEKRFRGNCIRNQNTHFVFRNLLLKIVLFMIWIQYCRTRHATDDNTVHAHCMLSYWSYKHTHSEYLICFAFALIMIAWMCRIVTLYIHCLPCYC
jgi:hypothetical protein